MLACGLLGFIALSLSWIILDLLLIIGGILAFLIKNENVMSFTNKVFYQVLEFLKLLTHKVLIFSQNLY
jgi:hypothetical protein